MDLKMTEEKVFYKEIGNEKMAKDFAEAMGIELDSAKNYLFRFVSLFPRYSSLNGYQKINIR